MAITHKGSGSGVSTEVSGGALSPLCPATVDAGDILICATSWEGTTNGPSTPSGWTLLAGPHIVNVSSFRHWTFGKIADGTEDSGAVALGAPAVTTNRHARVYSFGGRVSGTITDCVRGFVNAGAATAAVNDVGVTTTGTGSLAVNIIHVADNNTLVSFTGETGGTWTQSVTPYTTAATTPDYATSLQVADMASPGTINGGTQTMSAADPWGIQGFEVATAAAGPAATSFPARRNPNRGLTWR